MKVFEELNYMSCKKEIPRDTRDRQPMVAETLLRAMDQDDLRGMGGQHRVTQGASTFDDERPDETAERHRRAIEEFNAAMQEAVTEQFGQRF